MPPTSVADAAGRRRGTEHLAPPRRALGSPSCVWAVVGGAPGPPRVAGLRACRGGRMVAAWWLGGDQWLTMARFRHTVAPGGTGEGSRGVERRTRAPLRHPGEHQGSDPMAEQRARFVGTFEHGLDDKGRMVLPAEIRAQLGETGMLGMARRLRRACGPSTASTRSPTRSTGGVDAKEVSMRRASGSSWPTPPRSPPTSRAGSSSPRSCGTTPASGQRGGHQRPPRPGRDLGQAPAGRA